MNGVRYRAEPGWEKKLREQALPDMGKRAEIVATHVDRIQEGRFMGRKGTRPIVVVKSPLGVRVVNTKHGWHLQEFGSTRNLVQAPLRRGVIAAGLRFSPAPAP
jgi:hypothetical protein